MKQENRLEDKLNQLKSSSIDLIISALEKGTLIGNYQFPVHLGVSSKEIGKVLKKSRKYFLHTPTIMDMGCADGLLLITANTADYDCIGVEKEKSLYEIAQKNIDKAQEMGIITLPKHNMSIYNGDMLSKAFYTENNIALDNIDMFFVNQINALEAKTIHFIETYSKHDARILLYGAGKSRKKAPYLKKRYPNWIQEWSMDTMAESGYFVQLRKP